MSCLKQFVLNFTFIFTLLIETGSGAKLMYDAAGFVIASSDNPLDFLAKVLSVPANFWNFKKLVKNLDNFVKHHQLKWFYQ